MFFAARRNSWVERGPDGNLQEARHAPVDSRDHYVEGEKRSVREVVIEVDKERTGLHREPEVTKLRESLPTLLQVERSSGFLTCMWRPERAVVRM